MDPAMIGVLLAFLLVYGWLAAWSRRHVETRKIVTCPVTGQLASIERNGAADGHDPHPVAHCSLWPQPGCTQTCLLRRKLA